MSFVPNEDLIKVLQDLGLTRNAATRALYYTGNSSADMAAAFCFENSGNVDLDAPLTGFPEIDDSSSDDEEREEGQLQDVASFLEPGEFYKMVFIVNGDLNMGVGKVAAQVAHAALGLYRNLTDNPQQHGPALYAWEQFGESKIVLKGQNAVQLTELAMKARSKQLPHFVVEDAGRTQVAAGSMTALGIMGKTSEVDDITGSLSLL